MSIAEVVQEGNGTLPNPRLLELQERAKEIANYYYKGFGHTIDGILTCAEHFTMFPDIKRTGEDPYELLQNIEQFYLAIPFAALEGNDDFKPLFEVRAMLPKIRERMDDLFRRREADSFAELKKTLIETVELGRPYYETLKQMLDKIQSFPEGKNFSVKIMDKNTGHVYQWSKIA